MLDDKKLFTHILINALPGETWPPKPDRDRSGYSLYQHNFGWTRVDPWLFTGFQATIDFTDSRNFTAAKLRAFVQSQLYVRFIVGCKVQTEMCGVHLVEDVDRKYFEANAERTERHAVTENEMVFSPAPSPPAFQSGKIGAPPGGLAPDVAGRHPVLHGRLCINIAVPSRQSCELEIQLHDCGRTSLARELQDATGRRLIAIDVYGIETGGDGLFHPFAAWGQ